MESLSRISSLLESGKYGSYRAPVTTQQLTSDPARELTLDAAQATRSSRSPRPLDRGQIKKLLDSRHDREVLDGLRRILAVRWDPPASTSGRS